jgi:NitT/TauT family transport system permease protein
MLRSLYTRHVREALRTPTALGSEALLLALVLSIFGALLMVGRQMATPYHEQVQIDLSVWSLPKYTLLSLGRGFAAYFLSLAFTLVYGTYCAHHRRAETIMLPVLDVLQAIPVLGFLPGLVLALVDLFPRHELGLEMACIVMIFTGQVWNMTFSFHGSLKAIPQTLREVAAIHQLSQWRIFRQLEVPSAMIGLVWNSMMSMAGGWFFLTVTEAFTLKSHDYRLPGIGSYMNEAILKDDVPAMVAGVIAMVLMIIFADQVVWRPLACWSQRFKVEDVASAVEPHSWVLDLVRRSTWLRQLLNAFDTSHRSLIGTSFRPQVLSRIPHPAQGPSPVLAILWRVVKYVLGAALAVAVLWGAWSIISLLVALPLVDSSPKKDVSSLPADWRTVFLALGASFLRTSSAVLLGAAWTLPAGIMIGRSPRWSERLQPVIQVLASFPAPMLFPLVTILLFTLHVNFNIGCTVLMLLGTQWYILFNVIAGASSMPADLQEVSAVFHWSRFDRWLRLYIPCVFPFLVTGLITAAGGAWNATIVAEYVQMRSHTFFAFGLGSLISQATSNGQYSLLAAAVVTMAIAVVTINRVFWKRLYRVVEERFSLAGQN